MKRGVGLLSSSLRFTAKAKLWKHLKQEDQKVTVHIVPLDTNQRPEELSQHATQHGLRLAQFLLRF